MAHFDEIGYSAFIQYIHDHKTPATKAMDQYFKNPPNSIPDRLQGMLAKGWAAASADADDMNWLAGLINDPDEAAHMMQYPQDDLAKMWAALHHYCVEGGVPAEFFSDPFDHHINKREVSVHTETDYQNDGLVHHTKVKVTFKEPVNNAVIKMVRK
jgi:hypothetical protein